MLEDRLSFDSLLFLKENIVVKRGVFRAQTSMIERFCGNSKQLSRLGQVFKVLKAILQAAVRRLSCRSATLLNRHSNTGAFL